MVGFKNRGWLHDISSLLGGGGGGGAGVDNAAAERRKKPSRLGILCFETAKIMSRLVSLYRSLSDEEIYRLRKGVMKSEGVAFLNSKDEGFLMSLACGEMVEDLDRAASAVSRLGKRCNSFGLNRFDLVYTDLKMGIIDVGKLEYGSKVNERKLQKMERLISATSCLHAALDGLMQMEISERKMKQLKNRQMQLQKANFDLFNEKLENQRKMVSHFREVSLCVRLLNKSVSLMARIVCILFVRMSVVFGPYVPHLPSFSIKEQFLSHSGPITKPSKPTLLRFHSQRSVLFLKENDGGLTAEEMFSRSNNVFLSAGPSTLGGSGLASRYANVILLAEKYLDSREPVDQIDRESLYQMLPENLRVLVRTKLSKNMKSAEDDAMLAEGWRDAMAEMLRWLAPMAHCTVKWQMERSFDKMRFDPKPGVLLLQTLHFSDKVKTEAAIAELLVGLSCICKYENRV
ncbi:hypothetical protein F511_44650 [Dorcoceras hygrometricum]|uniref:Uncharacterized protein n=1 Tax=Dorcoceras hygrometricum TaxID=472368 RepID=A0A2Z7A4V1_9LAMI|nr:hypothetical protein F511_44650 [Dorcoceras hygrometricum]